jgi:CRP-like cAMP-binding protein
MPVSELALRSCKLFSDAPQEVLEQASQQMEIVQLRRREVLTYASKPFRGLGVVLQGRIQAIDQTLDGREVALQTVEASEAFGQVNLLATQPVQMVWIAAVSSSVALMSTDAALRLFQNGSMSFAAARELADQVSESLGWQKINAVTPISSRVCAWLCWSAGTSSLLDIPKHAELAWRLNTTRESITRTFQKLQADGLIEREDEQWRIIELSALENMAMGDARGYG